MTSELNQTPFDNLIDPLNQADPEQAQLYRFLIELNAIYTGTVKPDPAVLNAQFNSLSHKMRYWLRYLLLKNFDLTCAFSQIMGPIAEAIPEDSDMAQEHPVIMPVAVELDGEDIAYMNTLINVLNTIITPFTLEKCPMALFQAIAKVIANNVLDTSEAEQTMHILAALLATGTSEVTAEVQIRQRIYQDAKDIVWTLPQEQRSIVRRYAMF